MPGRHLLGEIKHDRAVFGAIYPGDASSEMKPGYDVAYRWIRRGSHKLIVPHGARPWGDYLDKPALYDIVNDPTEQIDLINDAAHQDLQGEMKRELDRWWNLSSD